MSRININGHWTTLDKLEDRYGTVECNNKTYYLTNDADMTSRLLPAPYTNYHEANTGEEFDFEMSAGAIDKGGNEFTVYWIFTDEKGENEKELDSFDYDQVNRIEEQ